MCEMITIRQISPPPSPAFPGWLKSWVERGGRRKRGRSEVETCHGKRKDELQTVRHQIRQLLPPLASVVFASANPDFLVFARRFTRDVLIENGRVFGGSGGNEEGRAGRALAKARSQGIRH